MNRIALALTAALMGAATPLSAQSYSAKMTYPNPDGNMALFRNKPCADPWVTIAVQIVFGEARPQQCVIQLYNQGRWSNFNQLVHAVAAYKKTMRDEGLTFSSRLVQGTSYVIPVLVESNTDRVVAAGAGNIVAAGAGNILVNNGGNIIGNNGANLIGNNGNTVRPSTLIGPDGATLVGTEAAKVTRTMTAAEYRSAPKVSAATGYVTMSTRTIRLPGGNMLVVK